jgi:serine protease AprX
MVRRFLSIGVLLAACVAPAAAADHTPGAKLDRELRLRALAPRGHSRVIVRLDPGVSGAAVGAILNGVRGTAGRRLASIGAQVADIPDSALEALARQPGVSGVSLDRRVRGTLERTGATIGAAFVRETLGLDGTGVGIAVVDSGVASWHDDLGSDRVTRFVDFVGFQPAAYDDYGHGTHVAGILAGSGYDSGGRRRGIAPGATLLVEKVLDGAGQGYISNVIAAIDYAIANKDALNLRVINLSVAAGVYESYQTDPLTLAAKRAVEAGLVVVSAAGNLGRSADGSEQYGGIGAPGNAPWVITVGASSHNGTADRSDDSVAAFSSRGPSAIDFQAKPDLVAPGVGIESLTEAGSTLYNTKPLMRLWGTVQTATEPYLSLSGTSMASPVVSGTIALMLQANPALTPNQVKAVLQFTAEHRDGYTGLTEGAGFLNARGAVELAQSLAAGGSLDPAAPHADPTPWSGHVIWGNRLVGGDALASAAWSTDVTWGAGGVLGASTEGDDENIVWGTECGGADCENIVWGAPCDGDECANIVWGTADDGDTIVRGTSGDDEDENIVRGTADAVDDVRWSAPAVDRPRRVVAIMDAGLR